MTSRNWLRPALVLGLAFFWLVVGGGLGVATEAKLAEQQKYDTAAFLPQGAESTLESAALAPFKTSETFPAIVVLDNVTSPEQVAQLSAFATDVLAQPVTSDGQTIADFIVGTPYVAPSADGTAAMAVFNFGVDTVLTSVDGQFMAVYLSDAIRIAWADAGIQGDFYLTGGVGFFADSITAFGGIDGVLLYVALAIVFLVLLSVYRSPALPIFVLTAAILGLGAASLGVYAMAKSGIVDLNGQSQAIMTILVVGATTDYSLLLVSRYREELRRFASPYDAMRRAWRRSLAPITASAITVILGLLTLLFSNLLSNKALGPVAAMGIAGAYVSALTFLPAVLLIGGARARWVFWPKRPTFHKEKLDHVDSLKAVEAHAGVWGKVSRTVSIHPRRIWVVSLACLGILAMFLPTFKASGVGDTDMFLGKMESIDGLSVLSDHFDAGSTSPIEIVASDARRDQVIAAATSVQGVPTAYALTPQIIAGAPPQVVSDSPLVIDGRVAIDAVTTVASSSAEAKDLVEQVRVAVHAVDPTALVGGSAAVALDTNYTTARDLRVVIPLILAVILIVLMVLLRAIVAPLIIVGANVLSFAATIGLSAIVFNHLFHFIGSDTAVPLFGFVFLVALGVDYSIFLMSRAHEETLRRGSREGIRRALAVTGGVITSAGFVLAATFGALAVLPILFMVQIAFIVAAGVLIDTLVVRTLLVPGVVYDLDRVAWWPWNKGIKA
jgi:putative drug exporter of the RND superfamily